ncbi:hypothetical protein [Methanohalobium sp.]|uniref:hypothetical protein n=1 Tax=Methanohalobium sp. TaxID=2837493 RepID=UPI0025D4BF04|nr:hypothetical protein [Methanohalobium sp.]
MKPGNFSGVVRSIDPTNPQNFAILILVIAAIITGVAVYTLNNYSLYDSFLQATKSGISVFLSWALARELDPDNELSALFSAGTIFIFISSLITHSPDIIVLVWILLIMRVINRTSGRYAGVLDLLVVMGLGIWLTYHGGLVFILITSLVFFLDGSMDSPNKNNRYFTIISLIISAVIIIFNGNVVLKTPATLNILVILIVSLLFLLHIFTISGICSFDDLNIKRLDFKRIRISQLVVLFTGVSVLIFGDDYSINSILPLWTAISGILIYRLIFAMGKCFSSCR